MCKVHILENEEKRSDGSVVNLKAGSRYINSKFVTTLREGRRALKEEGRIIRNFITVQRETKTIRVKESFRPPPLSINLVQSELRVMRVPIQ